MTVQSWGNEIRPRVLPPLRLFPRLFYLILLLFFRFSPQVVRQQRTSGLRHDKGEKRARGARVL